MSLVLGIDARLANAPQRAGVGNFCRGMLDALPTVAGDTTLRLYLDTEPGADLPRGRRCEVRVLPRKRFWTHRVLGPELRRDPPDVFWSPVLQLPLGAPCPMVATVHDLAVRRFPDQFTLRRRLLARAETRLAVLRAAHLCADSAATKADLAHYYRVASERMTVTHAGVAPEFHVPQHAADIQRVREIHALPGRFLLYVGRIQPRKNLERLIEAFEMLCARVPDLPHHLLMAGDRGWMEGPIHARAERSPVRGRIRFLGHVPAGDLPPLMAAADALALVSLWEGFGLPVVEAMACGTAVIASNCSSLPEVAGDAAVLVDPLDPESMALAIGRVLTDDAARHALERRGMAQAAGFTWQAAAARLMQAVRAAAGR